MLRWITDRPTLQRVTKHICDLFDPNFNLFLGLFDNSESYYHSVSRYANKMYFNLNQGSLKVIFELAYRWSWSFLYCFLIKYPRIWAWNSDMILERRSSRKSSSVPSTPARKNTLVLPNRYSFSPNWRASRILPVTILPSMNPWGMAFGARMEYLEK